MDKKLRIGILIREISDLKNWEYRIINEIINHPNLELRLFIKDGRTNHLSKKKDQSITKSFAESLFSMQNKIESYLDKRVNTKYTMDVDDIVSKVKDIETIYLKPERKGYLDIFSKEDADKIRSYNLDIILRHEFNIIRGDILNASKYGIWSFHHGDNAIYRGCPAGFWEIMNHEPYCGVTLLRLTEELDGGLIIDKAYFNGYWSFYKCNNDLLEKSVILLFKNINKLLRLGRIDTQKPLTYYNKLYRMPAMKVMLTYMARFYARKAASFFQKTFFKTRFSCWTLFLSKGIFLESTLYKIKPQKLPQDVFWADPFLFSLKDNLYVFFENYSYKTERGKISTGKVENNNGSFNIVDVKDILDFPFHLSYPQVFEEDGEIFLMPEMSGNKRLEIYHCTNFPDKWELYATAFEGEEVIDTTYFRDADGQRWLFLNKGYAMESELYVYQIDSLKLKTIINHKQNPVFIDCRKARNAGAIFKLGDAYFRPNQINEYGIYGYGLRISKIIKLTLDEYVEEPIISVTPDFQKGLVGMHHLHQINGYFVFDASYKKIIGNG